LFVGAAETSNEWCGGLLEDERELFERSYLVVANGRKQRELPVPDVVGHA
jgi:hypothetical protein